MEEVPSHISTTVGINTGRRLAEHSLGGEVWSDMDTATTLRGCPVSAMVGTDIPTGLQGWAGQRPGCPGAEQGLPRVARSTFPGLGTRSAEGGAPRWTQLWLRCSGTLHRPWLAHS